MSKVYVRFENVKTKAIILHGPFPFVQLTYDELRVGPDGEPMAILVENGEWQFHACFKGREDGHFTDVIVYGG